MNAFPNFSRVSTFGNDQLTGNPTVSQIKDRLRLLKRVQKDSGVTFAQTGIVFANGAIDLRAVPALSPTRKNADTIRMLQQFSAETEIAFPSEIKDALAGLDPAFNWDLKDSEISKWLGTGSELMSTAMAEISSTPLGMPSGGLGMNVLSSGMSVIGALKDGFISDSEIKNLSTSTGALVGGALGSIIPGVGTAIGAMLGSTVGVLAGEIVSLFSQPNWRQIMQELREQGDIQAARLIQQCNKLEQDFLNQEVLPSVYHTSNIWHNVEKTVGFRFDLRWFDANPGVPFFYNAYTGSYPLRAITDGARSFTVPRPNDSDARFGKLACASSVRTRKGYIQPSGGGPAATKDRFFRVTGTERAGTCNFFCPNTILGCLYPPAPESVYGPPRVLSAYRARGFNWPVSLQCNSIQNPADLVDCQEKFGSLKKTSSAEKERLCREAVKTAHEGQARALEKRLNDQRSVFNRATNQISKDLVRTTSLMKAQNDIFASKISLMSTSVIKNEATVQAQVLIDHVNKMKNLSLYGGASLLGLAMWRRFK